MLTRRSFFGTVAALAVGARVARPARPEWWVTSWDAPPLMTASEFKWHMRGGHAGGGKSDWLNRAMWEDGKPR